MLIRFLPQYFVFFHITLESTLFGVYMNSSRLKTIQLKNKSRLRGAPYPVQTQSVCRQASQEITIDKKRVPSVGALVL